MSQGGPFFFVEALPTGPEHVLDGPEGHHAATVTRLRPGEELVLADGRGGAASAVVRGVGRGVLELSITSRRYADQPDPRIVVVQGIAKGERGELAVQAMTEAGVDEIVPWAAARSVVQWRGDRGARARERWVATAREAAKQSRRPWLPIIAGVPDEPTAAVAQSTTAQSTTAQSTTAQSAVAVTCRLGAATSAYVLDGAATDRLASVPLPPAGEIVLVVGPEGGIDPAELAAFTAAGATAVRLGASVLRTSTAGVAALAVLSARLGRW